MQAVDLVDELMLEERAEGISMECDSQALPADSRNLCWRAAEAMRRRAGRARGVAIALRKKIPIAAGLGGGSSDAAGVLLALNELWGMRWSRDELKRVAAGLGSDVPFFIEAGTALCTGRGEIITPLLAATPFSFVLVTPPLAVPTPQVYSSLLPREGPPPVGIEDFLGALASGDPVRLGASLYNRLELNSGPHMGEVRRLTALLRARGALGACMSGSGPSVVGIAKDAASARLIAGDIRHELREGSFLHYGATDVGPSNL
jgi:4-diphosphocytidyl-2-C-methyl-D-erythritol kinase